jgi:hypothetical protein
MPGYGRKMKSMDSIYKEKMKPTKKPLPKSKKRPLPKFKKK